MPPVEPGSLTVKLLPPDLQLQSWAGAVALHRALQERLEAPVDLTLTVNHHSLFTARMARGRSKVRLHHIFTRAQGPVLDALAALASPRIDRARLKTARARVSAFAEAHKDALQPRPRRTTLKPSGQHHDLSGACRQVLARYFPGSEPVDITWARRSRSPQRSLRLGSFDPRRQLIRINPVLDHPEVPGWVIEFIIFHELLHRALPSHKVGGRYVHHGAEFRRREAAHPDHDRCAAWVRASLPGLLARAAEPGSDP